ncbi:MAG: glycosyltransferase family 4 protein [Candidatus Eremiobacteraeota bacterium]|nr:glycosyltransferase family 4 protein [Candidatus Eremiobacteraeota bacterium]
MRVLFVPREDGNRVFGGDVVQMEATARELRALGVEVEISPIERALEISFDVVHLWTSLHLPDRLERQLDALRPIRDRVRVALSPIWAPHHTLRWMHAARRWLFESRGDRGTLDIENARDILEQIARRSVNITVDGVTLTAWTAHPSTAACRGVLARVDTILPNSWMELAAIFTYLGDFCDHAIVPNAVDATLFAAGDPAAVPEELRAAPFALMSARFDARKQQDFVLLALKHTEYPLVFVGDATDPEIFARFRDLGARRKAPVYYYPAIPQQQLRHLYAAARVHLLPSLFESPGLSSLEALLADAAIVVGNLGFESEYFGEAAYYCDPCDAWSILRATQRAWNRYDDDAPPRARARTRIVEEFTWVAAAKATRRAYERALEA